jgi:hypothetical protein
MHVGLFARRSVTRDNAQHYNNKAPRHDRRLGRDRRIKRLDLRAG